MQYFRPSFFIIGLRDFVQRPNICLSLEPSSSLKQFYIHGGILMNAFSILVIVIDIVTIMIKRTGTKQRIDDRTTNLSRLIMILIGMCGCENSK